MMARTSVRIVVALALAALLGQPVGAVGKGGGGGTSTDPPGTTVTSSTEQVAPGWQKTGASLSVRTPYPAPGQPARGAPNVKAYQPPTLTQGEGCSASYSAGISLAPASSGTRLATWTKPQDYIKSTTWMMLSPTATADVPSWDGSIALPTHNGAEPGIISLPMLETNIASNGYLIKYSLAGTFQPSSPGGPLICMIDHYSSPHATPWCPNLFEGGTCSLPATIPTASPNPAPVGAGSVPKIETQASLDYFKNMANTLFTRGGTVVQGQAGPALTIEAVQIPAVFTLAGGPVDTPTQDLTLQVPIGSPNIGVVSYEVRIAYTNSQWWLDDHSSFGPYSYANPVEHRTHWDPELICQSVTLCTYTFDTIGHYGLRVIDHFTIEYRQIYIWNFNEPGGFTDSGWQAFPGAESGFDLCAQYADPAPAPAGGACGPGARLIVGQFEAVVVNPNHFP